MNTVYFVVNIDREWHSIQTFVADAAPEAPRVVGLPHGLQDLEEEEEEAKVTHRHTAPTKQHVKKANSKLLFLDRHGAITYVL